MHLKLIQISCEILFRVLSHLQATPEFLPYELRIYLHEFFARFAQARLRTPLGSYAHLGRIGSAANVCYRRRRYRSTTRKILLSTRGWACRRQSLVWTRRPRTSRACPRGQHLGLARRIDVAGISL